VSSPIGTNGGHHPLDDLAAYALGALDDTEQQAVDDHLAHCLTCRAELAGHRETLAALTPDEAPPAAVWQRIAVSIGAPGLPDPHTATPAQSSPASAGPTAPARPPSAGPRGEASDEAGHDIDHAVAHTHDTVPSLDEARARTRQPPRIRLLAAAASLLVAVATGGAFGYALGTSNDDSADIGSLAEQASQEPGGVLATLADTGGQPVARVVADEHGAYVQLDGLQNLPEGRAYQLWSLTGPQPVSLGMLGRDGTNTVAFRLPPTITDLAISIETTSGEVTPTTGFSASGSVSQST
jgi:anti-sigma-K factor RskA